MRRIHRFSACALVGVSLVAFTGCTIITADAAREMWGSPAATRAANSDPAKESKKQPAEELDEKRRKRGLLVHKLELTELERAHMQEQKEHEIHRAEVALGLARDRLTVFVEADLPNRIRQQEVEVEKSEASYSDAVAELEQLEMMYKASELEDKTSEIVLQRGRRQLQISRKELEIRRAKRDIALDHELPRERRELQSKLLEAELELESKRRDRRIETAKMELTMHEIRSELESLSHALERAEKKLSKEESSDEKPSSEADAAGPR